MKNKKAFTLVELILAISLFVIIATGVAVPVIGSYVSSLEDQKVVKANAVLTESWEAVRSIRNQSWENMTNVTHGLTNINGYWEFYGSNDLVDGITRTVIVKSAFRDVEGNIVDNGGTADPDSKLVKIQLSWEPTTNNVRMLEAESLVTNYKNPGEWPL